MILGKKKHLDPYTMPGCLAQGCIDNLCMVLIFSLWDQCIFSHPLAAINSLETSKYDWRIGGNFVQSTSTYSSVPFLSCDQVLLLPLLCLCLLSDWN